MLPISAYPFSVYPFSAAGEPPPGSGCPRCQWRCLLLMPSPLFFPLCSPRSCPRGGGRVPGVRLRRLAALQHHRLRIPRIRLVSALGCRGCAGMAVLPPLPRGGTWWQGASPGGPRGPCPKTCLLGRCCVMGWQVLSSMKAMPTAWYVSSSASRRCCVRREAGSLCLSCCSEQEGGSAAGWHWLELTLLL